MQNYFRIFILNLLYFWILLATCPLTGQVLQMKNATENDYWRWGKLNLKSISEKGKWVSFEMNYENKMDTLFLSNTFNNKCFSYPKAGKGKFEGEKFFAFLNSDSNLQIFNLKSFKILVFKDVYSYEFAVNGKYILTVSTHAKKNRLLIIRNESGRALDTIKGVTEHLLNSHSNALLYIAKQDNYYACGIIHFDNYQRTTITEKSLSKLYRAAWQENGTDAAFLSQRDSLSKNIELKYFRSKDKKIFLLQLKKKKSESDLVVNPREHPLISYDGKKVFFTQITNSDSIFKDRNGTIEIWNGNDKSIYPERHHTLSKGGAAKKSVWFPDTGSYIKLNDDQQRTFGITGRQDYALLYDKNPYGLQSKYPEEADFYLKKINTGSSFLFLKKQSVDTRQIKLDPAGNRIVYYREKNWWLYDTQEGQRINLTWQTKTFWDNDSEFSARNQFGPYGFGAWSDDGKNIILYDQYDLWLAAADGSYCRRLTNGRDKNISFRLDEASLGKTFSMDQCLILRAKNTEDCSTGYYTFSFKAGEKVLVFDQKKNEQILKSSNNTFVYTTQTFSRSPQIEMKANSSSNAQVLFESNKHQKEYFFGKSELIYYKGPNGEKLRAALFSPARFDASKKYPMIVYIYETQSGLVNSYENPTINNSIGFNVTNYTLNGYFVLLPDIVYKQGNPAVSALESVNSAVAAAVETAFIDKERIGLYGHSFGGYETNFIITQTKIFAAAASGAGISDNIGYYFNISNNGIFQSEMWRFESQQFRMRKSLYEDKESYLRNNPILNAYKVITPLLLWSGKEDRIVPYTQSVSYYLGLRKLKKNTIMILYPKEDHDLEKSSNMADLSTRIMQWFDYYLKNQKTPGWISAGTSAE